MTGLMKLREAVALGEFGAGVTTDKGGGSWL